MRYRSTLRRRKLTPKQEALLRKSQKAELRASVLAVGVGKHFEHLYDTEDLDRLTDVILLDLRPALVESDKQRAALTGRSPRKATRNPR